MTHAPGAAPSAPPVFSSIPARLAAATLLLLCTSLAHAQYQWIDEKGIKHFSDRPPPPSVPLKHILKAPKGQSSAQDLAAAATATAAVADTAAGAAPESAGQKPAAATAAATVAEREADYKKRQQDKAEAARKQQQAQAQSEAQRDNCQRARSARATLDGGARIGITDANGERGFMDDAQRAAEGKRVDQMLAGCKSQ